MSKGLTKDEYNALLHAQWALEGKILQLIDEGLRPEDAEIVVLRRDREALSNLFVRLA
jgi:hypothetical protein